MKLTRWESVSVNEECSPENKVGVEETSNGGTSVNPTKISQKSDFFISNFGGFQLRVYKPLIVLKIALFFHYSGSTGAFLFFPLLAAQRGLSVAELSVAITASAILQILAPVVAGVIADKIGRSKPILLFYLVISILTSLALYFLPALPQCSGDAPVCPGALLPLCNITEGEFGVEMCENRLGGVLNHNNTCYNSWNDSNLRECDLNLVYCDVPLDACHAPSCQSEPCSMTSLKAAYFVTIPAAYFFRTNLNGMFDLTVMALASEHKMLYAHQRIWTFVGSLFGPLVTGLILGARADYSRILLIHVACTTIAGAIMCLINIRHVPPGKRMWKKSKVLLGNPDLISLAVVLLVAGWGSSFVNIYFSLYMKEIGASSLLTGGACTIECVYGIAITLGAGWLMEKVGHKNLFVLSLMSLGAYCLLIFALRVGWPVMFIEVFFAFSYDLFWVVVVHFITLVAPEGLTNTVMSTASTLHFMTGSVLSSIYGGLMASHYGSLRTAFFVVGVSCMCSSFLYEGYRLLRHVCWKEDRKKPVSQDEPQEMTLDVNV